MNSLLKIEVVFPYAAGIIYFLTFKLQLSALYYIIPAISMGLYFFPLRLLLENTGDKSFNVFSSLLFSFILGLSSIVYFNKELNIIKMLLLISGIICFVLLIYRYFFKVMNIKDFFLLFGFSTLAGSYLTI